MAAHVPAIEELQKERLKAESHQKWIDIQLNTFTNWLNLQLSPSSNRIEDLSTDLSDGVKLIQIVESLQQKICTGKVYIDDPTEIQCLMNVQMALDALREDGVRTVNIGSHDIVNGNLKLILGLVWCLIQRYQIALKSKIPPKKLMMAWLQSVLPDIRLTNFRTNWNDGKALSALLEYCQPGLCPEWRSLNSKTGLENCERGLSLAEIYLDIPAILSAKDLHSADLDELSSITYLSYYVRRNGPGYIATLERVRRLLPDLRVMDFDRSWNDGYLLKRLVEAVGGEVEEIEEMDFNEPACWPENVRKALEGALKLEVASLVSAEDIADPDSEYLGVMALAAALCALEPVEKVAESAPQMTSCYRNQQLNLDLTFADGKGFRVEELEAVVTGPKGAPVDLKSIEFRKARTVQGAVLSFIPKEEGHHKVQIFCQGAELPSSPIVLQVLSELQQQPSTQRPRGVHESLPEIEEETEHPESTPSGLLAPMSGANFFASGGQPDIGHVSFSGLSEPCSIGSIVEVVINAHGDNSRGSVVVEASAPSARLMKCPVVQKANSYMATFTPNEVGKWRIGILYDGEHIKGSPFACQVYDANLVQVYGLDVGLVGQELKFSVDAAEAGYGRIKVTVLRHGRQIPSTIQEQATSPGVYRVIFTPDGAGQYKIHVLFNSMEVKGSPFILDIADASSVSVYGDNLRMASVDKLSTFMIHAPGSDMKDISITVTAPSNKRKHARVVPLGDSTYKVEWKAVEAGEHAVDVRLYNQSVYESPFICNVGDPELVSVKKMPTFIDVAELFTDHSFEIDASAAGSGNLEIMINGGRVACRVKELGNRHYLAQFTPTQPITHVIEMRFNGEDVRGSPWKLYSKGATDFVPSQQSTQTTSTSSSTKKTTTSADGYFELTGAGLQRAAVGKPSHFEILGEGSAQNVQVRIHGPNGSDVPVRIDQRSPGKMICEYLVDQVGEHRLDVTIDGRPLESGPLFISAYNADKITIEPLGGGVPNQPVQFIVDAVEAGKGQLEISVNQGRVPNNVQMQGAGRCLVTFIPQHPGTYVIDVTFNGEQVQGCPIRVEILPKQVGKPVSTPFISEETKTISSAAVVSGSTVGGAVGGTSSSTLGGSSSHEFRSPRTVTAQFSPRETVGISPTSTVTRRTEAPTSPTLVDHVRQRSSEHHATEIPRSPRLLRDLTPTKKIEAYDPERRVPPFDRKEDEGVGYTVAQYGNVSQRGMMKMFEMRKDKCLSRDEPDFEPERSSFGTIDVRQGYKTPRDERSYYESREEYRSHQGPEKSYESREETRRGPGERILQETIREESKERYFGREEPREKYFGQEPEKPPSREPPPPPVNTDIGMIKTSYHKFGERMPHMERDRSPYDEVPSERGYDRLPTSHDRPSPGHYADDTLGYSEKPLDSGRDRSPYDRAPTSQKRSTHGYSERTTRIDDSIGTRLDSSRDKSPYGRVHEEKHPSEDRTHAYGQGYGDRSAQDQVPSSEHPASAYTASTFEPGKMGNGSAGPASSASAYQYAELTPAGAREHTVRTVEYSTATSTGTDGVTKTTTTTREFHSGAVPHVTEYTTTRTSPAPSVGPSLHPVASARLDEERTPRKREPSFTRTQSSDAIEANDDEPGLKRSSEREDVSHSLSKTDEFPSAPLPVHSQRTADYMKVKEEDDKILDRHGYGRDTVPDRAEPIRSEPVPDFSPDTIEALTPATRRRLMEHSIRKSEDLKEEDRLISELNENLDMELNKSAEIEKEQEASSSRPSSKPTTPKLSFKFKKDKEPKDSKGVDFGKSKFSSKHEVVRRGKDVEVKLENLKLGKEDQLRVVVIAPSRNKTEKGEDIIPKVKKSRSNYEISFKPVDVGTHKVMAFVGDAVHPACPFPIRVYDASEIVIGDIVKESVINDTVEFTVDAGRAGFGNLEMAIKDNDGTIIPSHVSQLETGTAKFLVTFNPSQLGMHTVNITFNKEVLKNSPFEVNIIDVPPPPPPPASHSDTLVSSPELSKKERKREEKERQKEEKERLKREKEETLKKKKASKKGVPLPERKTAVNKIPSLSRVQTPAHLLITTAGDEPLDILVSDSVKEALPIHVSEEEPGVKKIEFTPTRVGDHEIIVKYAGNEVNGSPFTCRAYDPAKIIVGPIPNGVVDKAVHFVVDAREAGVGNLEVAVNEGRIPSMAHALGQHKYDISFVPREFQDHTISVRFNNEPVPGSPFLCRIVSSVEITASGPGLERVPVGEPTEFSILLNDDKGVHPVVNVQDSHGEFIQTTVKQDQTDPTRYDVVYTPVSVGNLNIEVEYDGEGITGSPFTAKAYDATCARLSAVEAAQKDKPCTFTIDAAKAGAGNMEIIVSVDNRNVPNFVQAEGQAKFKVSFTPQEARPHVVTVKFNGQHIPGSPMVVDVGGSGAPIPVSAAETASPSQLSKVTELHQRELSSAGDIRIVGDITKGQVGHTKGFSIDTAGRVAECNVIVTDSNGGPLSVRCYKQQDDSYWVEFTPESIGTHSIEVTFADVPVSGSPFKCEVVDPKKVVIKGIDEPLMYRQAANVVINRKMAGNGPLAIEVTDQNGEPLRVDTIRSPSGEENVTFLPTKLGQHKMTVKLAGFQVQGTPKAFLVEEQAKPCVYGSAVDYPVALDQQASLIFDPKKLKGGMKIEVRGPNGERVRHATNDRPDGTKELSFKPTDVGTYTVSVDFNNRPIEGSPFNVDVVDLAKVVVNDMNMDSDGVIAVNLNQRNVIDVDATAAGPGRLRAEVRDSDGQLLFGDSGCEVENLGHGKFRVVFTPNRANVSAYKIYLYFAEQVVPSAYPIYARVQGAPATQSHQLHAAKSEHASSEKGDYTRVFVRGPGLTKASIEEESDFIIDCSETKNQGPVTALLAGEKVDVPVRLTKLGNGVYKAAYSPLVGGIYQLHVKYDDEHVKGSPFPIEVLSPTSNADVIHVDTSTLKMGIINEDVKTLIDTRRAGPGQLSAQCMGPTQLAYCELFDHRDGTYTLSVRPSEVGKHSLSVKYSDEHVPGSPFVIPVSNPPDPSRVRVHGPGIQHGILNGFKSNFIVETRGAGAGQLTVRVRGPKGAFNVEMERDRQQDRTIHCRYAPREPGDYQVEVRWHGQHVPGSPFLVMIVDTEQELQRFLSGEAPSPTPATPFIPPGWVGPPPMMPPGHFPPSPRMLQGGPSSGMGMIPYGPPEAFRQQHRARSQQRYTNGY